MEKLGKKSEVDLLFRGVWCNIIFCKCIIVRFPCFSDSDCFLMSYNSFWKTRQKYSSCTYFAVSKQKKKSSFFFGLKAEHSGAIKSLKVQELTSLLNVIKTHERLAANQYNLKNHKR